MPPSESSEPGTPINARTRVVGLLGFPVAHSRSPQLHNAAFAAQDLNLRYVAFPVPPERLPAAVEGMRALGFAGANVTIPHKQAVHDLMDRLTPEAAAVGAVNTIVCLAEPDGSVTLRGDNTDVAGFIRPLLPRRDALDRTSAVVFGAGGAARATVYALLTHLRLDALTIAARNLDQAARLAESLQPHAASTALRAVHLYADATRRAVAVSRLLVNSTPLGMHPKRDATVWPDASLFGPRHIVYDLVYNPVETLLLNQAAARGAAVISGVEMFIGQAEAAYEQWTGQPFPVDVARNVLGLS